MVLGNFPLKAGDGRISVGKVRIEGVSEKLTKNDILELEDKTKLTPSQLGRYIKHDKGYVWYLADPFLFTTPVRQSTCGQRWKGRPNEHEQLMIYQATRRHVTASDATEVAELFRLYKRQQAQPEVHADEALSWRRSRTTSSCLMP